jgi:hypothetical protein
MSRMSRRAALGFAVLALTALTAPRHSRALPRGRQALGLSRGGALHAGARGRRGACIGADVRRGSESLEVGDARVAPLGILAYDLLIQEGDGLLGRDFLDLFKASINTEARVVVLSPR